MRYVPFVVLMLVFGAGCTAETSSLATPEGYEAGGEDAVVTDIEVVGSGSIIVEPIGSADGVADDVVRVVMEMQMAANNFSFTPSTITAKPGQDIAITFANTGSHTFAIDEIGLHATIRDGGTVHFVAPTAVGNYRYYCSMGSHATLGMEGVLTVK